MTMKRGVSVARFVSMSLYYYATLRILKGAALITLIAKSCDHHIAQSSSSFILRTTRPGTSPGTPPMERTPGRGPSPSWYRESHCRAKPSRSLPSRRAFLLIVSRGVCAPIRHNGYSPQRIGWHPRRSLLPQLSEPGMNGRW